MKKSVLVKTMRNKPTHAWVEEKLKALEAQKLRRQLDLPRGIDLTSNDTLSLKETPQLLNASLEAGHTYGVGSGGSRLLRGNHEVHEHVEKICAQATGLEATLLVTSGWHAVMAFTSAFVKKDDVVLSDALNHACLIDAIRSSGATKQIYGHLNLEDLKRQAETQMAPRAAVAVPQKAIFPWMPT